MTWNDKTWNRNNKGNAQNQIHNNKNLLSIFINQGKLYINNILFS